MHVKIKNKRTQRQGSEIYEKMVVYLYIPEQDEVVTHFHLLLYS